MVKVDFCFEISWTFFYCRAKGQHWTGAQHVSKNTARGATNVPSSGLRPNTHDHNLIIIMKIMAIILLIDSHPDHHHQGGRPQREGGKGQLRAVAAAGRARDNPRGRNNPRAINMRFAKV